MKTLILKALLPLLVIFGEQLTTKVKFLFSAFSICASASAQNYSQSGNSVDNSWTIFETNSPTNTYGNRYDIFRLNKDSTDFRFKRLILDSMYKNNSSVVSTGKFLWVNYPKREVKLSYFDSLPLSSRQITAALGYVPSGSGGGVTSFNSRTGAVTLNSADVTSALTYTPYNSTNPNGYISSISASQVTTAIGYTPLQFEIDGNTANEIQSLSLNSGSLQLSLGGGTVSTSSFPLSSSQVTSAIGYVPYSNTNPNNYLSSYTPTLGSTGYSVYASGGNTIALPNPSVGLGYLPLQTQTIQALSISGQTVSLSVGGGSVVIPTQTTGLLSSSRNITINGTTQDLSADRTWSLTTSTVGEGSNLYYTTSRFNTDFSGKTTTNLNEGSNLYYTDSRARNAISLTTVGTSGASTYNNSTGVLNIPQYAGTTPTITAGNSMSVSSSGSSYTVAYVAPTRTMSSATRTLAISGNSGFQISSTSDYNVNYSVKITCTVSISGSQTGTVNLQISPDNSSWTTISGSELTWGGTLVVGLSLTLGNTQTVSGFVPKGYYVRILTSGTGTFSYQNGQENSY